MDECKIEISEPKCFCFREVVWINLIGCLFSIILGLGLLVGIDCVENEPGLAMGCAFLILPGMVLFFFPAMCANPYVVRLVRRSVSETANPPTGFIVQMALWPRLHSGFRGWLEDADDVGLLHIMPQAIVFTGDHTVVKLPFLADMTISVHNIGWRGLWFCGKRIRVHARLEKGYEYVEFLDRSGWTLVSAMKRPQEILTQILSARDKVARQPAVPASAPAMRSSPAQEGQLTWLKQLFALVCVVAGAIQTYLYMISEGKSSKDPGLFVFLFIAAIIAFAVFCARWPQAKSLERHFLLGGAINYAFFFIPFLCLAALGDGSGGDRIDDVIAILVNGFPLMFPLTGMSWLACVLYCWDEKTGPLAEAGETSPQSLKKKTGILIPVMAGFLLLVFVISVVKGTMVLHVRNLEDRLRQATGHGTPEEIQAVIAAGAKINQPNRRGETPLEYALARNRDSRVIKALIQAGAEVNVRKHVRQTPLMQACLNGDPAIVTMLLQAGAEVKAKDNKGRTLLHCQSGKKPSDSASILALLKAGAEINARDNEGNTPLLLMLDDRHCLECIQTMLKAGADVNVKNQAGRTPLMMAPSCLCCGNNDPRVVEALLQAGAEVDAKDNEGKTPLMWSVGYDSHLETLTMLLKAGAATDVKDKNGQTLLMQAASSNETPAILAALLKDGQDINARDNKGRTPLMLAAADNRNPEIITLLLQAGARIDEKDNEGQTALMAAAAGNSNSNMIAVLVKAGADINARDNLDRTPLMHAAGHNGTLGIIPKLIKLGNDVNAKDKSGRTSLSLAAENNYHPAIVAELLKAGADIKTKDNNGKSVLNYARKNFYNPQLIVDELIKAGAK